MRSVDPVGIPVIGSHVVDLRGGLVVPGAPALTGVHADGRALIAGHDHARGVHRIDPESMVVVATGGALERGEVVTAIHGTIERRLRHVHRVGILRIDEDAAEVTAADDAGIGRAFFPGRAPIVRAEEPAFRTSRDHCIYALPALRGSHADAAQRTGGQAGTGKLRPGFSFVSGLVDRPTGATVDQVGRIAGFAEVVPQRGVSNPLIGSVEGDIHRPDLVGPGEHLAPRLAAIGRLEDAPLRILREGLSQGRDNNRVGIRGIDPHSADVLGLLQPDMCPCLAGVHRFVDTIAHVDCGTDHADITRTHVHGVWFRRRDDHGSYGGDALLVEDRRPHHTSVNGLPHTAARRRHVVDGRVPRSARHGGHTASAERTDGAPLHAAVD